MIHSQVRDLTRHLPAHARKDATRLIKPLISFSDELMRFTHKNANSSHIESLIHALSLTTSTIGELSRFIKSSSPRP